MEGHSDKSIELIGDIEEDKRIVVEISDNDVKSVKSEESK